jgi:hypothetical protein
VYLDNVLGGSPAIAATALMRSGLYLYPPLVMPPIHNDADIALVFEGLVQLAFEVRVSTPNDYQYSFALLCPVGRRPHDADQEPGEIHHDAESRR